jgi:outer membrane protein assembly factor BamA
MKYSITFLLVIVVTSLCFSQGENNSLKGVPAKERFVTGGGFGLGLSTTTDYFMLSPSLGYMLTKRLILGTSVTYRYTNYKFYSPSLKLNDYGVSPFLRFMIYNGLFAQAEYEYLNYEFPISNLETTRKGFSSFLAGLGYMQPLGGKAMIYVMALYNFSYQNALPGQYTAYPNPLVIRAGISIGNFNLF